MRRARDHPFRHYTAKNLRLDLFDPSDGHREHSAVITNKDISERTLWYFMCGRGVHEKVYGELKSGFASDYISTMRYAANSAWQWLSVLAFNPLRGFQVATTPRRSSTRKRCALHGFQTIHTLRYLYLHRAGLIVRPAGRPILDIAASGSVKHRFRLLERQLMKAA